MHYDSNAPFRIPAFRPFVPWRLQPWIYVVFAFCFQLSGARYMGALGAMQGGEALMREDLLMCLYANLAGLSLYFPLLMRMKFRFTNKTLLVVSALGVALCNVASAYCHWLPLLWAICFVEGMLKLQGTFECISNIQLWFAPRYDFTRFFPILLLFITGSMHLSGFYAAYYAMLGDWRLTHWLTVVLMLVMLLLLVTCTDRRRLVPRQPLYGIDWTGLLLWSALALEVAWVLTYGSWADWMHSAALRSVALAALVTLALAVWRMLTVRHPYVSPAVFRSPRVVGILALVLVVEALMGVEQVLEEVGYEEVMGYGPWTRARMELWAWAGCWTGCLFALWWMHMARLPRLRLVMVGLVLATSYLIMMYTTLSPALPIERFYVPVFLRGAAAALFSIALLTSLQASLPFPTFFQGLAVCNLLHTYVGGSVGQAVYAHGLSHYVADGMARYGAWITPSRLATMLPSGTPPHEGLGPLMPEFVEQVMACAVKTLYGWAVFAALGLLLALLCYDSPARRHAGSWLADRRLVGPFPRQRWRFLRAAR